MTALNSYIEVLDMQMSGIHCAMRDAKEAKRLARSSGGKVYAISFDVHSAFFSISASKRAQKMFGTSLVMEDGQRRFYSFQVAPQGFSASPEAWDRIMGDLTGHLREKHGMLLSVYCDDGVLFVVARTKEEAHQMAELLISELETHGITLSKEKSYPTNDLSTNVTHIGFRIDLVKENLHLKNKRLGKLKLLVQDLLAAEKWTPRQLQKFGGQIMSSIPVFQNRAFLWTRSLNFKLGATIDPKKKGEDLDQECDTCPNVRAELNRWKKYLETDPYTSFRPRKTETTSVFWGASDASATGVGGVLLDPMGQLLISAGSLSEKERHWSSTAREMRGIIHFVQSNLDIVRGKALRILVDNRGCTSITSFGSKKQDLQQLSTQLNDLVTNNDIELHLTWVPRIMNQAADSCSHLEAFDVEDHCLSESGYQTLLRLAKRKPTVDLYADVNNRKCKRHRSLFRGPDAKNSVSGHQSDTNVYAFPPLAQVIPHLKEVQYQNEIGTNDQHSILVVLGGKAMHASIRHQLETSLGYRPGVERLCKIPMREIQLGPNSRSTMWGNDRFHAEAFVIGPGFKCQMTYHQN